MLIPWRVRFTLCKVTCFVSCRFFFVIENVYVLIYLQGSCWFEVSVVSLGTLYHFYECAELDNRFNDGCFALPRFKMVPPAIFASISLRPKTL